MNEYDSEKIFSLMSDSHQPVSQPDQAEFIFVNTCSVREKAGNKLYSLLGTYRPLKKKNPKLIIGVGGCVAQQEGTEILKRSDLVDFVVGTHNLSLVPSLVEGARSGRRKQVAIDYREEWEDLPQAFDSFVPRDSSGEIAAGAFGRFYSPVRAMVAIQRGCNKHCSFCVVPTTRGPEVSRSLVEIKREIELKVRLGAREVLLLGQTVNSWGRDLNPRGRFEDLVEEISTIPDLKRIRFTSPHPADVRPGFIKLFAQIPSLCPHIHLPLQSGSDRILSLMNRNYRIKRYLDIVDSLRSEVPNIAISSDIIVGFPTESREDFESTLEVVQKVGYSFSFSFIYSERPNTTALKDFGPEDSVPEDEKKARLTELQALQNRLSLRRNQGKIGETIEVLVEDVSQRISSRSPENTPVELLGAEGIKPGDIVRAKVIKCGPHGLGAEVMGNNGQG